MKKRYFASLILLAGCFTAAQAQTTALDWTKTDCSSPSNRSHHLFSELDSGNVVVLEYVMMNCAPCVTGANGIKFITAPYATSHPGKVRMYSIGYTDSYTCSQMVNWKTSNNFTHPVFTEGAAEVAYYGGMGMPTIVVVGNSSHKVYYKKQGYSAADNAAIKAAIDQALAESSTPTGVAEQAKAASGLTAYPNPVQHRLEIHFEQEADQVEILDVLGRCVQKQAITAEGKVLLNTGSLTAGTYFVRLLKNGEVLQTGRFVKNAL